MFLFLLVILAHKLIWIWHRFLCSSFLIIHLNQKKKKLIYFPSFLFPSLSFSFLVFLLFFFFFFFFQKVQIRIGCTTSRTHQNRNGKKGSWTFGRTIIFNCLGSLFFFFKKSSIWRIFGYRCFWVGWSTRFFFFFLFPFFFFLFRKN